MVNNSYYKREIDIMKLFIYQLGFKKKIEIKVEMNI